MLFLLPTPGLSGGLWLLAARLSYAGRLTASDSRLSSCAALIFNDLYIISRLFNKGVLVFAELLTLGFGSKVSW